MIINKLPHHPTIKYEENQQGFLMLDHLFEGKQLYTPFIPNVLRGLYYLWGDTVILDSDKYELENEGDIYKWLQGEEINYKRKKVRYRMRSLDDKPDVHEWKQE